MAKLNENIRKFRVFRQITQADLASKLGKTKNVISNWENGLNSPDPDTIETICNILKVTPNQLFGWEPMPDYEKFMAYMEDKKKDLSSLEEQELRIQIKIKNLKEEIAEYTAMNSTTIAGD